MQSPSVESQTTKHRTKFLSRRRVTDKKTNSHFVHDTVDLRLMGGQNSDAVDIHSISFERSNKYFLKK